MSNIKLEEVFKTNGIPTYTFVRPEEYNQLLVALRTPGRGIVIEGPSGIGKTTSIRAALDDLKVKNEVLSLSGRNPKDLELINALHTMNDVGTVLIDDFHILDNQVKRNIADYLKLLADDENEKSKIIILGINHAGQTLIEFAGDLNNRLEIIRFESNPDEKIEELLEKGEKALNIEINVKNEVIQSSNGSFYIAQMLAHQICLDADIMEKQENCRATDISFELCRGKVFDKLSGVFMKPAESFSQGTRVRKEGRAPYLHLLYWLSESEEWSLNIDKVIRSHPEHRGSIIQVAEKGHLKSLIENNEDIEKVLHYDETSRILTVENPQFMYFIRNISWSKFAKDIGFGSIGFSTPYDFALSFAGEDREVAEMLSDKLEEKETQVFYDKNEQHRILASNIEDYLRPIYQSDAEFIIVLLGKEYPKKIWTKFESEQFKERFKENAVIPIWFSDTDLGIFDESRKFGGITIDKNKDLEPQVDRIVEMCCKKLLESREQKSEAA